MNFTTREIAYLKRYYASHSPLSLIANVDPASDESDGLSLHEKGILENDQLTADSKVYLDILAQPEVCTRLVMKNDFLLMEKYAYRKGADRILVENDNGELAVSKLENEADVQMELSQWIGASNVKSAHFGIRIGYEELLTFMALLDFYRQHGLLSRLAVNPLSDFESPSAKGLVKLIDVPLPHGLVSVLRTNFNMPAQNLEMVEKALTGLRNKGVLEEGKALSLKEAYKAFAARFLIPDTFVMMETLTQESGGDVETSTTLAMGSGVLDWLGLAFEAEQVAIDTLTSVQVLQYAGLHLECQQ